MKDEKAGILIFVMWVLIILSLFSIAISRNSASDIKLARHESIGIKLLYLAKAGVVKAIIDLNEDKNNYDSLNEGWNKEKEFKLGGGSVIYSSHDESARFNLNDPGLSKKHLITLGLDNGTSQGLLDYKAKKEEKGFEFMEELFLIEGMTRDMYSKIKDYVTIYRGANPRININTSDENTLRAVIENDSIVNKIIEFRMGDDNKIGTIGDGVFTEDNFSLVFENFGAAPDVILRYKFLFDVKSEFFRILAEASFPEDKNETKRIMAVVDRLGKIYCWKEGID